MRLRRRGGATTRPEGRPPSGSAKERVSFGQRLQRFLRSAGARPGGPEATKRRRLMTAGLVLYLAVLIGTALAYNLPLLRQQAVVRSQAERETRRVASMQRLLRELDEERLRRVRLLIERDVRYRALPSAADLPIAVDKLRQVPALSGGSARGVDYSEPRWSGNNGQLQTHATFSGTWPEALAYIAALHGVLPESALERLTIRFDGPGSVAADLLLTAAALRERPEEAPVWDGDGAWQRAEAAVQGIDVAGSPFTPSPLLWHEGYAAGMDLPELRLAGIARQRDGNSLALFVYDGETQLVRPGSRIGEIEVVAVDDDGVVISIAGRAFKLQVGKGPQAW